MSVDLAWILLDSVRFWDYSFLASELPVIQARGRFQSKLVRELGKKLIPVPVLSLGTMSD